MDLSPETNQPNLENKEKEVGSQNAPYFYKITPGQRDGFNGLIFHAQIGNESFTYGYTFVNSQGINLRCKVKGCPATAYARIPKSTGLIKWKGTRKNYGDGKGHLRVKARLESIEI